MQSDWSYWGFTSSEIALTTRSERPEDRKVTSPIWVRPGGDSSGPRVKLTCHIWAAPERIPLAPVWNWPVKYISNNPNSPVDRAIWWYFRSLTIDLMVSLTCKSQITSFSKNFSPYFYPYFVDFYTIYIPYFRKFYTIWIRPLLMMSWIRENTAELAQPTK